MAMMLIMFSWVAAAQRMSHQIGSNGAPFVSPFAFGQGAHIPGMKWFKDAKFGMFMHWGPIAQWGAEISFPLMCTSLPCHPKGPNNTVMNITTTDQLSKHRQAYADLANTFDPVDFNASNMAKIARAAGFKYLIFTTVHCDGFLNWPSNLSDYSIVNTPWGKKGRGTYSELVTAFRAEGLKVGAYVCPSLWNNDSYWAPDAKTALAPCCKPNYLPASKPELWERFTTFLHGLVTELVHLYAPDAFWFDCMNSPPDTDTKLEAVLHIIRDANANAVINVREGLWSDYMETGDEQIYVANDIMGINSQIAGDYFEVATSITPGQWTFGTGFKHWSSPAIIASLMLLTSKNGNLLLNIPPDSSGVWPKDTITSMTELSDWFAINGEAIHGSRPIWPYQPQGYNFFTTASANGSLYYVLIPSVSPATEKDARMVLRGATVGRPVASPRDGDGTTWIKSKLHTALVTGAQSSLQLGWLRPSLFASPLTAVELLGGYANVSFTQNDSHGVVVSGFPPACARWNCTCDDMGIYYGVGPKGSCPPPYDPCNATYGCAPIYAQNWWKSMGCTAESYFNKTTNPVHPGCEGGGAYQPPHALGLVLKLTF